MAVIPEPDDQVLIYWPARDADEYPLAVVRDDATAALNGDVEAHWFTPNDTADPLSWERLAEQVERSEDVDWGDAVLVPLSAGTPAQPTETETEGVGDGG